VRAHARFGVAVCSIRSDGVQGPFVSPRPASANVTSSAAA
jgi:hypothetical protein